MPERQPAPGSAEWLLRMAAYELAVSVAGERPQHGEAFASQSTLVAWERIEALRAALDACGLDWRA